MEKDSMAERGGAYRVTSRYFLPASKSPIGLRLALSRANRTLNITVQETSLAQHLKNKRRPQPSDKERPFFGRGLEILSEVMQASGPLVIHVHGVSGIGKPALIFEFAAIWRSRKRTVLLLDGRTIEPTEGGFQHELSRQLRIQKPALGSIVRVLSKRSRPVVIVLDSYELLALLDAWLRQAFLSRLGKKVLLIFVSRFAPAPQWTRDPNGGDLSAHSI
jgi:hypothetical protein